MNDTLLLPSSSPFMIWQECFRELGQGWPLLKKHVLNVNTRLAQAFAASSVRLITNPPYGGVTQGGYMKNQGCQNKAKRINYDLTLWSQEKPNEEYFKELFRVSKNQVIWGGQLLSDSHK